MHDVIIVGGGPAGFTAALYSSRARLDTLVIERLFAGGQMATTYMMENYPGFEEPIGGADLALRMENQARRFGAKVINEAAVELELEGPVKTVKTTNNVYRAKTLILAMGASPRELGVPGEKELRGQGVSYCATCDGAFFADRVTAVIGGGDTAVEDALFLSRFCRKIYLVHRRDSLRAARVLQESLFSNNKVEIVWNTVVEKINGKFGVESITVRNVLTGEVKDIETDGVFVAVGNQPNSELVRGKLELTEGGYIRTDENMRTSVEGVFAAGDIREKVLRQVITAAADGAIAAYMAEKYLAERKL